MTEEWRPVWGYVGRYEVSSEGRVRSLRGKFGPRSKPLLITKKVNRLTGYVKVDLSKNGKKKTFAVHRLVCRAFNGAAHIKNADVAHLNGVKTDNRKSNLRWVSRAENMSHMVLHGTYRWGETHKSSVLLERQVAEMRRSYTGSFGQINEMARTYGVSRQTVSQVLFGARWGNLKDPPPCKRLN